MKLLLLIHLFLLGHPAPGKGPGTVVSFHVKEISFSSFCDSLYRKSGVTVYYQEAWVRQVRVTLDTEQITVVSAVEKALKGTSLRVSVWNNKVKQNMLCSA